MKFRKSVNLIHVRLLYFITQKNQATSSVHKTHIMMFADTRTLYRISVKNLKNRKKIIKFPKSARHTGSITDEKLFLRWING